MLASSLSLWSELGIKKVLGPKTPEEELIQPMGMSGMFTNAIRISLT